MLGFYVKADSSITSIKEPKDVAGLKVITGAEQGLIVLMMSATVIYVARSPPGDSGLMEGAPPPHARRPSESGRSLHERAVPDSA